MFQIVLNGPGYLDTRFELPPGETLLGRAEDNHVVLSGDGVSRYHARLTLERDRLRLEDLRSVNGTRLNGRPVQGDALLRAGDRIEIGENQLSVDSILSTSEATTEVLRRPLDEMRTVARLRQARALAGSDALGAPAELESLALLSLVSERLANAPSLDAFLVDVAELVLELARARTVVILLRDDDALSSEIIRSGGRAVTTSSRGSIPRQVDSFSKAETARSGTRSSPRQTDSSSVAETVEIDRSSVVVPFREPASGRRHPGAALLYNTLDASPRAKAAAGDRGARGPVLVPATIRHLGPLSEGQIPISWSIVHRCITERVALCVEDAALDPRFAGSESVVAHGVHQAICVPLLRDDSIVGALYVNRRGEESGLERLLEALSAIAHLAASGIEQQQLKDRAEGEAKMRRSLERFLAPDVVDRVVREHGGGIGMEERIATVIFADISGFTAFTEKEPATRVVELLDEFYRRMTSVVFEHRGTVDKFIGDAVMAVFGAPYSHEDDAERALLAAIAMRASFDELMASWPEDERCALKIGLNTGRLLAGTVGGDRLEYTAVGDTVNVASRLVAGADPGQIVAARATIECCETRFDIRPLGERSLRGRSSAVSVFEVLDRSEPQHP